MFKIKLSNFPLFILTRIDIFLFHEFIFLNFIHSVSFQNKIESQKIITIVFEIENSQDHLYGLLNENIMIIQNQYLKKDTFLVIALKRKSCSFSSNIKS